jgi:tRNA (guanine-N7-)-methyltransferase
MESTAHFTRTFRPRRRGLPPSRAAAYARLLPVWGLGVHGSQLRLDEVFCRPFAAVVLDIGFGGGEALVEMAAQRPHECVIGVEVHTPGVARVLDAIDANGWSHVRVVEGDVVELLPRLPLGCLEGIRLWFPDPWLKNKQRHRRIVRPDVVSGWVDRLRIGGVLHLATDVDGYARQVEDVMAGESRLAGGVVTRPEWRPVTRFEERGRREGRIATDLRYERIL